MKFAIFILCFGIINLQKEKISISRDDNVLFVFEHSRHGARSPNALYGANKDHDIFGELWTDGEEELTTYGMGQHFDVGKKMQKKYGDLIDNDPSKMFVLSTDKNRTILSAGAQIYGLFGDSDKKPTDWTFLLKIRENAGKYKGEDLKDSIKRSEFLPTLDGTGKIGPQINIIKKNKLIQLSKKGNCPAADKFEEECLKEDIVQDFVQEIDDNFGNILIDLLKKADYFKDEEERNKVIKKLKEDPFSVYAEMSSAYQMDVLDNRKLKILNDKRFDRDLFGKRMEQLFEIKVQHVKVDGAPNHYSGKYDFSLFSKTILDHMEKVITEEDPNAIKFLYLSGHDGTLMEQMDFMNYAFGLDILKVVKVGSTLTIEVRENSEGVLYVLYKINDVLYHKCSYDEFKKTIEEKAWNEEQIKAFCHGNTMENGMPNFRKNLMKGYRKRHFLASN